MHAHQKLLQYLYSLFVIKMLSCRQVSLLLLTLQSGLHKVNQLSTLLCGYMVKKTNERMDG